jgi:uncharacterized protein YbbC (DUF1343 family)
LLANGEVFGGNNQENAAYPSGLCAERVAMFYANAYNNFDKKSKNFFLLPASGKNYWFDTLAGTDELRLQIIAGKSEEEIRNSWKKDLQNFEKIRTKYRIYED